jgi:hypothetical protein
MRCDWLTTLKQLQTITQSADSHARLVDAFWRGLFDCVSIVVKMQLTEATSRNVGKARIATASADTWDVISVPQTFGYDPDNLSHLRRAAHFYTSLTIHHYRRRASICT